MKRLLIILLIITLKEPGLSQTSKLVSALNYLEYNELDKSREAIDLASQHESTKDLSKTWYFKGLIYHTLYIDTIFSKSITNALEESFTAFVKCKKIDTKQEYTKETDERLKIIAYQFYNKGVAECKSKDFKEAIKSFNYTLQIIPNDPQSLFNSAYAANSMGDMGQSKIFYQKLISIDYNEPKIYHLLSEIYKSEADTAAAIEVLKKGRSRFSSNNTLIIDELNIYLHSGQQQQAIDRLNEATTLDPQNHTLFFALGVANDKVKNNEQAEKAYIKAIELKPDYFDAVYNLGALYFNTAVDMVKASDLINPNDLEGYKKAKTIFDSQFQKSLPYLEKALQLNADDINTITSLKQLYTRMGLLEKAEEMQKKLK